MREKAKLTDYRKASEILIRNPFLQKFWNCSQIGRLLELQLVRGKKLKRGSLLYEPDVIRIFRFGIAGIDQ